MSISAVFNLALGIAALLAAVMFAIGYMVGLRAERRVAAGSGVVAAAIGVAAILVLGTFRVAQRYGPVVTWEALIVSTAMDIAIIGGFKAAGVRKKGDASGSLTVVVVVLAVVCSDLAVASTLNHKIASAADQLLGGNAQRYEPEKNKDCPNNLRSLYLAFQMYAQDWDALPPADGWMRNDDLISKVRQNEWLHCPAVSNRHDEKFGYAYNSAVAGMNLHGKALAYVPGAKSLPLLFDSSNLQPGASDRLESLPRPGRHGGRNNILMCDGSVQAVAPK